jgi:hypothetical protein
MSTLSTSGLALDSACAVLYSLLACGAVVRLVERHRQNGFPFRFHLFARMFRCAERVASMIRSNCCCGGTTTVDSQHEERMLSQYRQPNSYNSSNHYFGGGSAAASNGAKKGYLVMLALFLYCVMRAIQLALFAAGVLDSSGDITTNMYRFVPALGFMAVQSAMLNKWIDHVSELTLVLQHQAFGIGQFLITCSVFLMIADAVLTVLAMIDTEIVHFSHQPGHMWNVLVNMFCGVVYAFNGIAFSGLGCFLRYLWIPVTPMGAYASRRILGIALIFGIMCIARGSILLMYIDDDATANTHVHTVTHNDWGAPSVLLFEWTALVISLFLLTVAKHHQNNSSMVGVATIPSVVAFTGGGGTTTAAGGGGALRPDEERSSYMTTTSPRSLYQIAGSVRENASSSQFYIGAGRQSIAEGGVRVGGGEGGDASHSRYSMLLASEISLATIHSDPQSARRHNTAATGGSTHQIPPRPTAVSSSPFTTSSRVTQQQQQHTTATSQNSLRRSVDAAGLRIATMRGASGATTMQQYQQQYQQPYHLSQSSGAPSQQSQHSFSHRRTGGLRATAVTPDPDDDGVVEEDEGRTSSSVPYVSQRSDGGGGSSFFLGGGYRSEAVVAEGAAPSPQAQHSTAALAEATQPEETIQGGSQRSLP